MGTLRGAIEALRTDIKNIRAGVMNVERPGEAISYRLAQIAELKAGTGPLSDDPPNQEE